MWKRGRAATLIFFLAGTALAGGSADYVDLAASQKDCPVKVFPYAQGLACASGDFDQFVIRRLTDFGERPVWSPDGKKIAFMDHEFGDAYELDLGSQKNECLTCRFPHPGFLRVHYLKDGDYLLLGPRRRTSALADRVFHTGFWWMPADRSVGPRWIGEEHYEGVAVSRESRKIAYTKTWLDSPFHFPSALYVAEVSREGEIVNRRAAYWSAQLIETQDFLPGDRGVTMARYTPEYEAVGVDLATGKMTDYSNSPASEEPEGLFPDGRFTLIESDRHSRRPGDMDLELYMLRLDGSGRDARRLTHFTDVPGEKASNPAVSPEGCRIAFMKAKKSDNPARLTGLGDGIFLLEFYQCGEDRKKS
jgi:hypothetical protein